MGRTNLELDDDLVAEAMRRFHFKTKREAVDYALRQLVTPRLTTEQILALEGAVDWDGDLVTMRDDPGPAL